MASNRKGKEKETSSSKFNLFRRPRNRPKGVVIQEESAEQYYAGDWSSSTGQVEADREYAEQLAKAEAEAETHNQQDEADRIDLDDEMDEDDGGLGADECPPSKKRAQSDIFKIWFTKKEYPPTKEGGKPIVKAHCNFCDKVYVFSKNNGYGTYKKHITAKHAAPTKGGTQTQLGFKQGTSELNLFNYNDIVAREVMAKFVATESLAFQFTDSLRFENSMKTAYNPRAKKISCSTMTRTIQRLSLRYKKGLRDMFTKFPYRVSVCSDIWTCAWQKNSYLGMTVHWVDPNWNLQKRILCFKKFNCAHTAQNIAMCIIKVLNSFRLTSKIFSIGFDNASANTASVPELITACNPTLGGKYFHTRCICHILNLCVQDGMKILENSITPIRKCVMMLRDKVKLHKKWLKFCKERTGHAKAFNVDVVTRWNSTYDMLNSTMEYKSLLCEFFGNEVSSMILLSTYWDECVDLIKLLEVFQTATKELSGVYYPTSSRVLTHCVYIALRFHECSQNPNLVDCINMMVIKWLKYFTIIPPVFLIATCLDPSMKYDGVCALLEFYYGYLNDMTFAGQPGRLGLELPTIDAVKINLNESLQTLFTDYVVIYGGNTGASRNIQKGKEKFKLGIDTSSQAAQKLQSFFQNRYSSNAANDELGVYLQEAKSVDLIEAQPNSVDLLGWWSKRVSQYPVLSIMAREILAVPASTVAVEQAFSVGGYVLDERRSTMAPHNLEAQILLKDYTLAEAREQENKWDEVFTENPISTTENETDTDTSQATSDDFDDDFEFDIDM